MSLSEVEGEGCGPDHVSPILTCPREEQATRGQSIDFFLPPPCSAQLCLEIAQIMLLIPNILPLFVQKLRLLLNSMTRIRFLAKPHVKPLLDAGERFVLEKDNGSGHGSADNNNMVRLEYFFNAPKSPDLACVENCWQSLKSNLLKEPHWTDDGIMAHADYIWDTKVLLQPFIDG